MESDDYLHGVNRLLDYANQFSRREIINSAIVLKGELRRLQAELRKVGNSQDGNSRRNYIGHRILEILDEAELSLPSFEPPSALSPTLQLPQPLEEAEGIQELSSFEKAGREFAEKRRRAGKPAVPASAALAAHGIRKDFGEDFTLSGVDLVLLPGEITGVIGVNGSGKTTLLRILSGELAADGGELTYPLLSADKLDWLAIRSQIAYVPQRPPRWHGILEEVLYLHAALNRITGRANEDEVEFILHRLGLEDYRKARWHEISGGFQMRFELAKALLGQPKILILDEPLAPLDINTQQVFLQDLKDISRSSLRPLPIILSSQHIYEVEAIADSILFLDQGRVVFCGALAKLSKERSESTYEFMTSIDRTRLLECLDPLEIIDLEHTGLSYIATFPIKVTARQMLEHALRLNLDIIYFRDISGSSRKFFKGRGE